MKVLITGSSGALGAIITDSLISKKIEVAGIDIKRSEEIKDDRNFRFYKCSITDKECLDSIFNRERPTHVIHFASTLNRVRNRKKEYEIDVGGSKNILELCNSTSSVRQLIFSSSAAAYGGHPDNPSLLNEVHVLRPGNYRYGLNKKEIEDFYSAGPVRDDLKINMIRICTVVGPTFNKSASVVTILLRWSWLPEFCRENKVQFIHSDDLISLIHNMMNDSEINGIFNIAPDSWSVVGDLCPDKKYIGMPVFIASGILFVLWNTRLMNLQPAGVYHSLYPVVLDSRKIRERYGYRFKYSSTEAFEYTRVNNRLPPGTFL